MSKVSEQAAYARAGGRLGVVQAVTEPIVTELFETDTSRFAALNYEVL